jgi:hypothetical protein
MIVSIMALTCEGRSIFVSHIVRRRKVYFACQPAAFYNYREFSHFLLQGLWDVYWEANVQVRSGFSLEF